MKKLLAIMVLGFLFCVNAYAETVKEKRSHYIYNNLSMDYNTCQNYFLIMSEALKTNNPDPVKVKNFVDSSKLAGLIAFDYGAEAGLTNKAMLARSKILVDEMLKSINNDFTNMSVLFVEYGELCKSMIETPEIRNQHWINKANEKYK
jgi:hypothetical protein